MSKKNIFKYTSFVIIFVLFIVLIIYIIVNNVEDDTIIEQQNNDTSKYSKEEKTIDISKKIDPSKYDSLEEFIGYFNTGSWVILDVDMEKEDFYTKKRVEDWKYIITLFDKDLINHIDTASEGIKEQAIMDIYNSYKEEDFLYWEPTEERDWVRILDNNELEPKFQLHNNLLMPYEWENYYEQLDRLESKQDKSTEDYQQLAYLYDFSWDYQKANQTKEQNEIEQINYSINWKVFNQWEPVPNAKIEVLNTWDITYTDKTWYYEIDFDTYPMTRARFRASKDGLSDGYNWVYILYDSKNQTTEDLSFNLHKYDKKVLIKQSDLSWWDTKTVTSSIWNSFVFEKAKVITKDWNTYNKDFYAYIYEFDRQTPWMENFLWLDNFDPVYGYSWDMMVTAWMTYMMMTTLDWEELFISKQNPIITRQQINMDIQYNNDEEWTNPLTKEQFELLLKKSKEPWYTIDRVFLENRGISWLSPWWVLNKSRWVWENRPIKIINKDWLKESLYYNVD